MSRRLMIVDDETDLRWMLRGLFEDEGFAVEEASDGAEALASLRASLQHDRLPDVVLTDMRMPNACGLTLLREMQKTAPDLPVVLLSAVEDLATAVDAIKEGAFDYQSKPFDQERLLLSVRRAAEQHALRRELHQLRAASGRHEAVDFGVSSLANKLHRTLELVAPQDSLSILIAGESGTGKEVTARAIHAMSPLRDGPFVAVDCGALPEHLLESQLFGHEKGAFTGADKRRTGLFATADRGTLFLDELGNLPLPLQAKLLRALQERTVVPVGGSDPVPFQARLLTATNADLEADVEAGTFRVDLYHRIAEFVVELPALRERPDDIAYFARIFLAEANVELGRRVAGFTEAGQAALQAHPWTGNLRELRNAVRRMVLLATTDTLDAADLGLTPAHEPPPTAPACAPSIGDSSMPLAERLQQASHALEEQILRDTLTACDGNKAAAARALQIDYTTLHRKLKRHSM
ncbi:MAG: sigma-54-dependent transcriptional regulator [Planctomycetota bacterium]